MPSKSQLQIQQTNVPLSPAPCSLSEKTRLVDVLAASQKDGSGLVCARTASSDSTLVARVRRFKRVNEARTQTMISSCADMDVSAIGDHGCI